MPNIHRLVSNYQGVFAHHNTSPNEATLQCRKLDLYRSIITVGNPSFFSWQDIRRFGLARALYDSILEKVALVASNIESDRRGIRRHPIFNTYILDKKRIVSYNLGMAFAKLYSEKLLEIPNLIHIEFLKKTGAVTFVPQPGDDRPREPDLVGQTPDGNWHIVEAKGVSTSESHLQGKIAEAKHQIQQVATIQGAPPLTGTACATYLGEDRIFSRLEDPTSGDGKDIQLVEGKFYTAYYAPFLLAETSLQLDRRRTRIDGLDVEFFDLKKASRTVRIGLASEVVERVTAGNFAGMSNPAQLLRRHASSVSPRDRYSIGLDGFVIGYISH